MKTTISASMLCDRPTQVVQCATHGAYTSINWLGTVWSKCPKCIEAEQEAEQAERHKREMAARLLACQIPDRFTDCTLDNYEVSNEAQSKVLDFSRKFAENFAQARRVGQCVLFIGSTGTGKNHLSVGIAKAVMARGYSAHHTTTLRAVRRIKETWAKGASETEGQAVAAMVSPDLLILDEVGMQFGSDIERTLLFDLLNDRYERMRPTLFLSNLDLEGVKAYLGQRIFSRLRECGGRYFPFTWGDYRAGKTTD